AAALDDSCGSLAEAWPVAHASSVLWSASCPSVEDDSSRLPSSVIWVADSTVPTTEETSPPSLSVADPSASGSHASAVSLVGSAELASLALTYPFVMV